MKIFRDHTGFTLLELMTVVAIIGIVVAMAIPSMKAYQRKELTRGTAKQVSGWVGDARSQAIAGGRMTFLLLEEPTNGLFPFEDGQFASLVIDSNGNLALDETDTSKPIYLPPGAKGHVKKVGPDSTNIGDVSISPDDETDRSPGAALAELADGTTLPMADGVGVPAVAFSPQGAPVAVNTPDQWGTGAGGIYLTDNETQVLAVLVMPLGEVKLQAWDSASGEWK